MYKSELVTIAENPERDSYVIFKNSDISEITLDSLMAYEILVFTKSYNLDNFITLLDNYNGYKGSIKLLTLPEGSFDHLIKFDNGKLDYSLGDIKSGDYAMNISYKVSSKKASHSIKKRIRVE